MKNPFSVVTDFEDAMAEYTGAPYCAAVNSCTNALFLCMQYHADCLWQGDEGQIIIPNKTYISVPMQIMHAGFKPGFRDEDWLGYYELAPLNVWDSARWLYKGIYSDKVYAQSYTEAGKKLTDIYRQNLKMCFSLHWSKTLGVQQGGIIAHSDAKFQRWIERARFDGRTPGVPPSEDKFDTLGWHMYMSPEIAAEGLVRMQFLQPMNSPLPNDDYPDLSKLELFK